MNVWKSALYKFASTMVYETGRTVAYHATKDGRRRPMAWVQDTLFLGMVDELESQGIKRQVAADMMGLSLRTYHRHMNIAKASRHAGTNMWHLLLAKLQKPCTQEEVLAMFSAAQTSEIKAFLNDMIHSKWIQHEGNLYQATHNTDMEWNDGMLDEYLMMASNMDMDTSPEALEKQTDVPVSRWIKAIQRKAADPSYTSKSLTREGRYLLLTYFIQSVLKIFRDKNNKGKVALWSIDETPSNKAQVQHVIDEVRGIEEACFDIYETYQKGRAETSNTEQEEKTRAFFWTIVRGYIPEH